MTKYAIWGCKDCGEKVFTLLKKNIENENIKEDVIVQKGYTKFESKNMILYNQLPLNELEELIDKSDLIITHGGVGSIIMSIKKNKKVIAIPRLKKYNEHVNDHQLDIVKTFNDLGYIIGLNDVEELDEALKKVQHFEPKKYKSNTGNILKIIESFIDNN